MNEVEPLDLQPGWTCLEAGWTILARLSVTNQSVVYKARQEMLGRIVALKVLVNRERTDTSRFLREAQILRTLDHPHVGRLFGCGQLNGYSYMLMEWLDGESLAQKLERGPVGADLICAIVRDVTSALSHAGAAGIVHRDVKPSNIFVEQVNEGYKIRLIDFGIARQLELNQNLTSTDALLGSPAYMSPEQCSKSDIDERSDIYSLGCVLYECITGRTVFSASSPMDMMYKHLHESPAPINDGALGAVVLKCLAKSPAQRYQTASDLQVAFAELEFSNPGRTAAAKWRKLLMPSIALALLFGCSLVFVLRHNSSTSTNSRLEPAVESADFADIVTQLERLPPRLESVAHCELLEKNTRTAGDMMRLYRLHLTLNDALKQSDRSLAVARQVASLCDRAPASAEVAITMLLAANVLRDFNQYIEAENLYLKAIEKRKTFKGGLVAFDIGSYRLEYSGLFRNQKRFEEERQMLKLALSDLVSQANTYPAAKARHYLANNSINRKDYKQALEDCKSALAVLTPAYVGEWSEGRLASYRAKLKHLQSEALKALQN